MTCKGPYVQIMTWFVGFAAWAWPRRFSRRTGIVFPFLRSGLLAAWVATGFLPPPGWRRGGSNLPLRVRLPPRQRRLPSPAECLFLHRRTNQLIRTTAPSTRVPEASPPPPSSIVAPCPRRTWLTKVRGGGCVVRVRERGSGGVHVFAACGLD